MQFLEQDKTGVMNQRYNRCFDKPGIDFFFDNRKVYIIEYK